MNTVLVCVNGTIAVVKKKVDCTGIWENVPYAVPTEITGGLLVEAFAFGMGSVIPVLAVIWGGKQLLKSMR